MSNFSEKEKKKQTKSSNLAMSKKYNFAMFRA